MNSGQIYLIFNARTRAVTAALAARPVAQNGTSPTHDWMCWSCCRPAALRAPGQVRIVAAVNDRVGVAAEVFQPTPSVGVSTVDVNISIDAGRVDGVESAGWTRQRRDIAERSGPAAARPVDEAAAAGAGVVDVVDGHRRISVLYRWAVFAGR